MFTIDLMKGSVVIAVRISTDEHAALAALAEREQTTLAALLRQMVQRAVQLVGARDPRPPAVYGRLRSSRITVRLSLNDAALLDARAEARGLRAATYASTLLRAHLRSVAPLPQEEVRTLKRLISELTSIGRNLNQLARAANQGQLVRLTREDLMGLVKVCEGLRKETKGLLRVNLLSWGVS